MFKKNVTVTGTHQLGGKDAKKLRLDMAKHFPSLSESDMALLLPPKSTVTQSKMSTRSVIFSLEDSNQPLFFDPTGHGDKLIPTVYALSLVPGLIPTVYTHSEVSSKLLGGADLFLQGVLVPPGGLGNFLAGSVRSISVPGNPVPFAVGVMAVSAQEAAREGMKGRGLTLYHAFGDLLWHLGDKRAPNEGFTPTRIHPLPTHAGLDIESPPAEEENMDNAMGSLAIDTSNNDEVVVPESGVDTNGSSQEAGIEESARASIDMDSLLEHAVLGGLKAVKTADLPIMTSDFYQKYMLPLKPDGITYDFKKSKYKKLSKLLDKFEKERALTQKQIRKQDHISAVNRDHPLVAGFTGMPSASGAVTNDGSDSNNAANSNSTGPAKGLTTVSIAYLYRVPSSLRPVFEESAVADKDRLYSEAEVRDALHAYAGAKKMLSNEGAPESVQLDALLVGALWGKKEGPKEGDVVPAGVLLKRLLDKLQVWHRVVRPPSAENGSAVEVLRKGQLRPISILSERRSGRNVTAVARVEGFGYTPSDLAAVFQRRFKTACSVSKLPGKVESDCELMLQGSLAKQVVAFFSQEEGIDPKYLDVLDKLKK